MDAKIQLAIFTGIIGLITAIVAGTMTFFQSRKIEKLKNELELQKDKDTQVFKYFLAYETDTINQYFIHLKDFLIKTQAHKDQLREIIKNGHKYFPKELNDNLTGIKQSLINEYSKSVFYFNKADTDRNAHTIKNLFIELIDSINSQDENSSHKLNEQLNEISIRQIQLQKIMEEEIDKLLDAVKQKS
jgi:hypothetical protein